MFKVTVQSVESKCLHAVQYVSAETCSIIDLKCLCSRVEGVTWIPGWCLYRGAAQFSGVWLSGVEAVTQSGSPYKIIHRYTTSCWLFIHIRSSSVTDSSQSGSWWIQSLSGNTRCKAGEFIQDEMPVHRRAPRMHIHQPRGNPHETQHREYAKLHIDNNLKSGSN